MNLAAVVYLFGWHFPRSHFPLLRSPNLTLIAPFSNREFAGLVFRRPTGGKSGELLTCWNTICFSHLRWKSSQLSAGLFHQLSCYGEGSDWVIAHGIKNLCWPTYHTDVYFSAVRWMGPWKEKGGGETWGLTSKYLCLCSSFFQEHLLQILSNEWSRSVVTSPC